MDAGRLHRVARLLREVAISATADPGESTVSPGDLAVVEDVSHHEGTAISEIAERTRLAQSLVSKSVQTMRAAGILTTSPDPADGRRVLVTLNRDAQTGLLRARAARPIDEAVARAMPNLTEGQLQRLLVLLDDVADLLSP